MREDKIRELGEEVRDTMEREWQAKMEPEKTAAEQKKDLSVKMKPSGSGAPSVDPWAGRSQGMRCRTCMWFVEKGLSSREFGRCRRHAPTMNGYPAVFGSDWCGDHKVDENKV